MGNPAAWDRYSYVLGNPINATDPTGHVIQCLDGDEGGCGTNGTIGRIIDRIETKFQIVINNDNKLWNTKGLFSIERGMKALMRFMGERFQKTFTETTFSIYTSSDPKDINRSRMLAIGKDEVQIGDLEQSDTHAVGRNTVHELAHIWDARCDHCMSQTMMDITGSKYENGVYTPDGQMPGDYPLNPTVNGPWEDWAESVTNVVFPGTSQYNPWDFRRQDYVGQSLNPNYYGGLH